MTRKYSLVIEGDSTGCSAYVPELPTIVITGASLEEIDSRASDAIRLYWETIHSDPSPTALIREIEVETALLISDGAARRADTIRTTAEPLSISS